MFTFYQTSDQDNFFQILPEDWRREISSTWQSYEKKPEIYLLKYNEEIVAGGIVVSVCPPDMYYNRKEAQKWFDAGYLYIGFLWVTEAYRSHGLGSKWLQLLKDKHPTQKFWLTIEVENLQNFYTKNGFQLIKPLQNGTNIEWLLSYKPK